MQQEKIFNTEDITKMMGRRAKETFDSNVNLYELLVTIQKLKHKRPWGPQKLVFDYCQGLSYFREIMYISLASVF